MESTPVREVLGLCSFSFVVQGALASGTGFRRGLGLEMVGRTWGGTEGEPLCGSENEVDETSCELL